LIVFSIDDYFFIITSVNQLGNKPVYLNDAAKVYEYDFSLDLYFLPDAANQEPAFFQIVPNKKNLPTPHVHYCTYFEVRQRIPSLSFLCCFYLQ